MKLAKKIFVEPTFHRYENRLKLLFSFDKELIDLVKTIPDCKWSATMNCWHIPANNSIYELRQNFKSNIVFVEKEIKKKAKINLSAIILINKTENKIQLSLNKDKNIIDKLARIENHYRLPKHSKWFFEGTNENYLYIIKILKNNNYKYRIEYKKDKDEEQENPIVKHYVQTMMMRNNSQKTIDIYTQFFKEFVDFFSVKEISKLKYSEINFYIQKTIREKKLQEQSQKQLISAIKYYYEKIKGRDKLYFNLKNLNQILNFKLSIPLPEILKICESVDNNTAKLLLIFYYSFGLTFSEISELTLEQSKKKFKSFFLNYLKEKKIILQYVNNYYEQNKPQEYFFESDLKERYTAEQIELFILMIIGKFQLTDIYKKEFIQICYRANIKENSAKNYLSYFLTFLKHFNFIHPLIIKDEQIRKFLIKLNKSDYSKNTINQYINVIKLYYEKAHKREISGKFIFRPKIGKKLPAVLNQSELSKIFASIENLKHKTLLLLAFSGGFRRAEVLNLTVNDIDFERNEIKISSGKGNKDRITLLSEIIKPVLIEYIEEYRPKKYLFEGATGGKYSVTSFAKILKKAVSKANITKPVTIHTLRHTFATHLLEQGTDIRYIQELLGHKSIKTTLRYTHVAKKEIKKIKSPLDNLNISDSDKPP